MNSYIRSPFSFFLVIFGLACASLSARTLDITQVDLFTLKGWDSAQVSVEGMWLGMSLDKAALALSKRGLGLFDDAGRTPCSVSSRSCYVARHATDGGTVDVALEGSGRIAAIYIAMPEDPATLPRTIAGRLRGATRGLFFHYSDTLRTKLLGTADGVDKGEQTRFMQFTTYTYCRLGVRFYTARLGRRGTNQLSLPELMSVEFFSPDHGCSQKR